MQKKYVINLVDGMSQREAYYKAGGKAKTDITADSASSTMFSHVKVKAFYDSLIEHKACSAILTRSEAMEILSGVAKTKINDIEEYKLVPVLPAIKQLAQMEGWDSATKHEHTGKDGGPIETTTDIELARKLAFLLTKGEK